MFVISVIIANDMELHLYAEFTLTMPAHGTGRSAAVTHLP